MSNAEKDFELYNQAVSCYRASEACGTDQEAELCLLTQSSRYLTNALLTAEGITASDSDTKAELDLLREHGSGQPATDSLANILDLSEKQVSVSPAEMRETRRRYLRTLFETRGILVKRCSSDGTPLATRQDRTGGLMVAVVVCLIAGLVLGYRLISPVQSITDTVQIYWLAQASPWQEDHSVRIESKTDDVLKPHIFSLPRPMSIIQIRLDPSMLPDSEIEIRYLELVTAEGKVIKYDFAVNGSKDWFTRNIQGSVRSADGWRFRTASNDPYVTSPRFPVEEVKRVNVRMRSRQAMSIVRWLIGD